MVNIINTLTEKNKELLAKIEELENLRKTEISREAQLKIIDKIEKWKKENYETGDRLKKYEGNTYPSFISDYEDGVLKCLAGHVNFELSMVQYLHKKENPLDELLEMMLNSITRNVVGYYNLKGLEEKERKEWKQEEAKLKGKITRLIKETFPYDKLEEKPLKWNERIGGVERGYLDTINGTDYSDFIISFYKEREEELKEKKVFIGELEKELEAARLDAETHFEALTETSKEWNERKLEWWVGTFYKKLLDLNTVKNWQIEDNFRTIKVKDDDLERASERIKVLENFVAWQEYVADKQFQELPVLPKKEKKFKMLASKIKNKVNEVKVVVKEKFNAYILQKSK